MISIRATVAVLLLLVAACTTPESDGGRSTTTEAPVPPTTVPATTTEAPVSPTTVPATTTAPAPQLGDELLVNGDFEDGDPDPAGWELTVEESGHVGDWVDDQESGRAIRMEAPLVDGASWPQLVSTESFPVSPDRPYLVGLQARTDGFGLLFLAVAFQDADGAEITAMGPGSLTIESGAWSEQHFTVVAPERAASASLIMRLALNTSMTDVELLSVYVDDVTIREVLD